MTSSQRTSISTPTKGLLVYDTDLSGLYHYSGSGWFMVGGSLTLPYNATINQAGDAFSIINNGVGSAISGSVSANSVAAVEGSSTAVVGGYGVLGSNTSATGFGVGGINATGTAVYGFSNGSGTALRGISTNGYGLLSSGNLRLTGGNTNPSVGAVLTSVDGSGNAVWKPKKIAFSASFGENQFITENTFRKIEFSTESYDFGGGFVPYVNSTTTASSVFTAPVSGLYHFSVGISYSIVSNSHSMESCQLVLYKNDVIIATVAGEGSNGFISEFSSCLSKDLILAASDRIYVGAYQTNDGNLSARCNNGFSDEYCWFTGHLITAD